MSNPVARYEGLANWYDTVMNDPGKRGGLTNSAHQLLTNLVGPGEGIALDIGCGTGIVADLLRNLGYHPLGLDLAADQLRIAAKRLPVAQADGSVVQRPGYRSSHYLEPSHYTSVIRSRVGGWLAMY